MHLLTRMYPAYLCIPIRTLLITLRTAAYPMYPCIPLYSPVYPLDTLHLNPHYPTNPCIPHTATYTYIHPYTHTQPPTRRTSKSVKSYHSSSVITQGVSRETFCLFQLSLSHNNAMVSQLSLNRNASESHGCLA